ncbi:class I SAM-dependent methyltransferase [Herbiconiux moechotypicola]|uniref:Class I SAM-dependent methyltransferase n=1 Tax=Herbiconiux moechotypicola TaxID=637393 RepID=A0ABN3DRU6_9MICO|nr:class I SAM-dependent methyltransferase [Herbiconiux moechotypicola]MCS5730680.1 class I SAM-dependent methyltransferase [Herbiconiux moechotypicola]
MPIGAVTRGTTNTNRLRRVDRWIAALPVLGRTDDPVVVDLGYGASGVTAFELQARLARVRPEVEVVGFEISPERVATAQGQLAEVRAGRTFFDAAARVGFALGGFEVPLAGGRRATVIRAFNVLRQYAEPEVAGAWELMASRLQPGGMLVEGTCDEIGRVSSWVAISPEGPVSFTVSLRLTDLELPSIVAERLPKALIHRNVDGERVHRFLVELDRFWRHHAGLGAYGPVQRWVAVVESMAAAGWSVRTPAKRRRLGELTVDWADVAPAG